MSFNVMRIAGGCRCFFLCLLMAVGMAAGAQSSEDFEVVSCEIAVNDLSARTNQRVDGNGRHCGLLKVRVNDEIARVMGNVVGDVVDNGMEKWVYVTHDTKEIELHFRHHMPLRIRFDDYNIPTITGRMTYILRLREVAATAATPPAAQPAQQVVTEPEPQPTEQPAATQPTAEVETFTVNGVSFDMVRVPGGTFQMGGNSYHDEQPIHSETVGTFSIGKTEVTQALWKAVMGKNPSKFRGNTLPVDNVSWDDCQEFIINLNEITGQDFRLPTEIEWEYAARGGNRSNGYEYSGSDNISGVAWCWLDNKKSHPVGTKSANELGLHDMSGNICEWTNDKWSANYSSPRSGSFRVARGGSWNSSPIVCQPASRFAYSPSDRLNTLGLRLAL